MATRMDGVGDKALAAGKRVLGDVLRDAYHTAGVKWEQGMVELGNAMYQGTPVPMPQAITTNQLDRSDLKAQYEAGLDRAHDRAAREPREQDRAMER